MRPKGAALFARLEISRLDKIWCGVFLFWMLFLSGALASFMGSPGVVQSIRLNNLLSERQKRVNQMQDDLLKLQSDAELLEKNKVTQHREIRKVLGYAATDEIIFDFSSSHQL